MVATNAVNRRDDFGPPVSKAFRSLAQVPISNAALAEYIIEIFVLI